MDIRLAQPQPAVLVDPSVNTPARETASQAPADWMGQLPPDVKARLDALAGNSSLSTEDKLALANAIVEQAMKDFEATSSGLPENEKAQLRATLEEALGKAANEALIDRAALDKISKMDIQSLIFYVMSQRAEQLDSQVKARAKEIQERNELMKQTNAMMAEARTILAGLDDGESANMSPAMKEFFAKHGIETQGSVDSSSTATSPEAIQTQIDKADEMIASLESTRGDYAGHKTDDGCRGADVPDDVRTYCQANGIEMPDDGDDMEYSDFNTLINDIENKKAELQGQKDTAESVASGETSMAEANASAITTSQNKDQWQANIDNLKGFLEGLNNDSQLDMIKFQSIMSQFTTQIEMLSNTMKKLSDTSQGLAANLK